MQCLINLSRLIILRGVLLSTLDEVDSFFEIGFTHKVFSFQRENSFSTFFNYKFFLILLKHIFTHVIGLVGLF